VLPESLRVTLQVVNAIERLGVRYAIGGSVASALHGVIRATIDADIVAELRREHVEVFSDELSRTFYLNSDAIREAIDRRGHFNVIQLETMFKVDVFIPKDRAFDHAQLERRALQIISVEPKVSAYFCTAEDTVLAKLDWYKRGGMVSERQWLDVLGVIRVQGDSLDRDYLCRMAGTLGVFELLETALDEATRP
jgi:hypothetical protein